MLFSVSIDIWSTTVCTPDDAMVWMRVLSSISHIWGWIAEKSTLLPLPFLIPCTHKTPPNISSSFPPKNTYALVLQSLMWYEAVFSVFDSKSVVHFAVTFSCSLCFLLFVFFNSLISFWYSFSYFYSVVFFFHFCVVLISFLCFFSAIKRRCFTVAQPQSYRYVSWAEELAESIAVVWLCRERTRALQLWGFPRINIGAGPTVYSKRTAVLMEVHQGEGHLFF